MGDVTKIQWADHTFNPWIGCTKVHAGCTNCYAEADMGTRRKRVTWGPHGTRSKTSEANWRKPVAWNKNSIAWECPVCGFIASTPDVSPFRKGCRPGCCPNDGEALKETRARVFCASLADVFEEWEGPIVDHTGCGLYLCDRCGEVRDGARPEVQGRTGPFCQKCKSVTLPLTLGNLRQRLFSLIDATPHHFTGKGGDPFEWPTELRVREFPGGGK